MLPGRVCDQHVIVTFHNNETTYLVEVCLCLVKPTCILSSNFLKYTVSYNNRPIMLSLGLYPDVTLRSMERFSKITSLLLSTFNMHK